VKKAWQWCALFVAIMLVGSMVGYVVLILAGQREAAREFADSTGAGTVTLLVLAVLAWLFGDQDG
jgi:hypothetical protein